MPLATGPCSISCWMSALVLFLHVSCLSPFFNHFQALSCSITEFSLQLQRAHSTGSRKLRSEASPAHFKLQLLQPCYSLRLESFLIILYSYIVPKIIVFIFTCALLVLFPLSSMVPPVRLLFPLHVQLPSTTHEHGNACHLNSNAPRLIHPLPPRSSLSVV